MEQARAYVGRLHERFETLGAHPLSGREAGDLMPGLRRLDYHGTHIVFYLPTRDGVFIVRVLHQSMDAKRHL